MYKLKIEGGIATAKSVGCFLNENEYEVTGIQFLAAKIPCTATVNEGAVVLGSAVDYTKMEKTVRPAHVVTQDEAREYRDRLLSETDYTQMADSPLTEESRLAFATYRQGLRDITDQVDFPTAVNWPEMPAVTKA